MTNNVLLVRKRNREPAKKKLTMDKVIRDKGYYDIHKVVNGDYIRFGVKMNDVGQLYIYNIHYTNYAKDVWCEKYELGVCDDGAWVYDYEFNNAKDQINYIIDK